MIQITHPAQITRPPGNLARLALACLLLILVAGCQQEEQATDPTLSVTLVADGQQRQLETRAATVGDLLAEAGVQLEELDQVEPPDYTPLTDDMTITVTRIRHEVETEERVVPYERHTVRDTSVPADESRILEPGQNGRERLIYNVVYHDGVPVERNLVRRVTVTEAQPETVLVGARDNFIHMPITGTIAYLAGSNELGYNAWVMRDASGTQRALTSDGSLDTRVFALSPDGTRLLFTRYASQTLTRTRTVTDPENTLNSLWLIDTVSRRTRPAEPVDLGLADVLWAAWSPDGQSIAYATGEAKISAPGWQAHNDLWTAGIAGSGSRTRLSRPEEIIEPSPGGAYGWWGAQYAWSPDGRYIAYAQADSIGIIRLRDGQRTELHRFTPYRTYSQWVWVPSLSWAPDSRFLTAVTHGPSLAGSPPEDSQVFDVWVFDIQQPLAVKQVGEAGMWAAPTWSPALRPASAASGSAGTGEDRSSSRSNGNARAERARESLIAYGKAHSPYESVASLYDLYVMDRDGSNRRRLYPVDGDQGLTVPQIAWGPDGGQLLTVHQGDLFLIDLADAVPRRLTLDTNIHFLEWTR